MGKDEDIDYSQPQQVQIPVPVGGIPDARDRAASILFAVAYLFVFLVWVWRFKTSTTRTWIHFTTVGIVVERMVSYSLRTTVAFDLTDSDRYGGGMMMYMQMSFAQTYLQVTQDLVQLLRVLLVNYTNSPDPIEEFHTSDEGLTPKGPNDPVARKRHRLGTFFLVIAYSITYGTSIAQGSLIDCMEKNPKIGPYVQALRYTSASLGLAATLVFMTYLFLMRERIWPEPAGPRLMLLLVFLLPISMYRLVVMRHTTKDMTDGVLDSSADKAFFYLFHCLPELVVCALLLGMDVRRRFRCGPAGDWRHKDGEKRVSWKEWRAARRAKREARRQDTDATLCDSSSTLGDREKKTMDLPHDTLPCVV